MAFADLPQAEADRLLAMEKYFVQREVITFPHRGHRKIYLLLSADNREEFLLEIWRGRANIRKVSFQNRAKQVVVLLRLDIGGAPHRNPDGQKISGPHLHLYREGDRDSWAIPIPSEEFANLDNPFVILADFMRYCNIIEPPQIQHELPE